MTEHKMQRNVGGWRYSCTCGLRYVTQERMTEHLDRMARGERVTAMARALEHVASLEDARDDDNTDGCWIITRRAIGSRITLRADQAVPVPFVGIGIVRKDGEPWSFIPGPFDSITWEPHGETRENIGNGLVYATGPWGSAILPRDEERPDGPMRDDDEQPYGATYDARPNRPIRITD